MVGLLGIMVNTSGLSSPEVLTWREIVGYLFSRKDVPRVLGQAAGLSNTGFLRTSLQRAAGSQVPDVQFSLILAGSSSLKALRQVRLYAN
ncbi:unnamed protein product [Protopolystoma xenopodis]|uniref:Uncharacterized protein n=1 Tax=Protopolystoma xenopodis TaxID=117903 RepID=A0A3S5BA67_9PLAT|nr:unnamed protein product [Protopolystoma xenopodis]